MGPLRRAMDGALAPTPQLMHGVQIPLDDSNGQSGLPQRGDQARFAVLAQHHAVQFRWGQTAASASWTIPGDIDVLGNFRRNLGQLDDLPSALGPTAGQLGSAVGAALHHVFHRVGVMRRRAKPWRRCLRGPTGGFRPDFGAFGATPGFAWSSSAIRRSTAPPAAGMACSWAMMAWTAPRW